MAIERYKNVTVSVQGDEPVVSVNFMSGGRLDMNATDHANLLSALQGAVSTKTTVELQELEIRKGKVETRLAQINDRIAALSAL